VAESAMDLERKRQRVQVAARIASALIGVYANADKELGTSGIKAITLAGETVRLTDAILARLKETEN
jgi:hypothetical protein